MDLFVSFDGDRIGRLVGQASLNDDEEGVRRISQRIDTGNRLIAAWVNAALGAMISYGGDELRARIPATALADVERIRVQYAQAVGSPVSVGVGIRLSEADKALLSAKVRGGDQVVLYGPDVEKDLEQLKEKSESEKLGDEYLTKSEKFGQAAFRHRINGHIVPSGLIHDANFLPGGEDSVEHYEPGFLNKAGQFVTEDQAKEIEGRLQKDDQSAGPQQHEDPTNNASAGGGYTPRHESGAGGPPEPPMQEASEHSEGEAMRSMADETSSPEGSGAAGDFESELHDHAKDQDQKDSDDADAQKGKADARQKVLEILAQVKQAAPSLEQLRDQAPDLYGVLMQMTQALIITSRGLLDDQQSQSDSEKVVEQKGSEGSADESSGGEVSKSVKRTGEVIGGRRSPKTRALSFQSRGAKAPAHLYDSKETVRHMPPAPEEPDLKKVVKSSTKYAEEDYSHLLPEAAKKAYRITVLSPSNSHCGSTVSRLWHESKIVGTVLGHHWDGKTLEPHSDVKKQHRGKGLGTALYQALYEHVKKHHGIEKVVVGEEGRSDSAERIHQKLGKGDKQQPSIKYAYHATAPENIPGISSQGLLPKQAAGAGPAGKHVYVSEEETLANDYGDEVLRFPWPNTAIPFRGEDEHIQEYAVPHGIPADQIEHRQPDGSWRKLSNTGLKKATPPGFSEKTMEKLKAKHGDWLANKIAWAAHGKMKKAFPAELPPQGLTAPSQLHNDLKGFLGGLKVLPVGSPERGRFLTQHLNHPPIVQALQATPQGRDLHAKLMTHLNGKANAGFKPGATVATAKNEDELEKVQSHLNLPVGAEKDGRIKVRHEDGHSGWVSVRSGQVLSNDNHPISSRNPGGK
jgi:GNAT superfamily N-acetyltransferase